MIQNPVFSPPLLADIIPKPWMALGVRRGKKSDGAGHSKVFGNLFGNRPPTKFHYCLKNIFSEHGNAIAPTPAHPLISCPVD
ncbi:hypothetical protein [Microcoleus sp. K4-C2]|uniref:hypothetical protein n=1 Tax=Microcoleus sp. K4-C2 TaxID=2818792 RepID=UPI002FD30A49